MRKEGGRGVFECPSSSHKQMRSVMQIKYVGLVALPGLPPGDFGFWLSSGEVAGWPLRKRCRADGCKH